MGRWLSSRCFWNPDQDWRREGLRDLLGRRRSLVDEHLRGRRNRSGLLWRMLVLELWHRNFADASRAPQDAQEVFAAEVTPALQMRL